MTDTYDPLGSPLRILRELQENQRSPKSISAAERRACVEHLNLEGYSPAEVAEIFSVSPRTIQRDLERIREENALGRDPALVQKLVGELLVHARASVTRLQRTARDRSTDAPDRIQANLAAWQIHRESIEILQGLGYLPKATQKVEAELTHHVASPLDSANDLAELQRLREVLEDSGVLDPELASQLDELTASARSDVSTKLLAAANHGKDTTS